MLSHTRNFGPSSIYNDFVFVNSLDILYTIGGKLVNNSFFL